MSQTKSPIRNRRATERQSRLPISFCFSPLLSPLLFSSVRSTVKRRCFRQSLVVDDDDCCKEPRGHCGGCCVGGGGTASRPRRSTGQSMIVRSIVECLWRENGRLEEEEKKVYHHSLFIKLQRETLEKAPKMLLWSSDNFLQLHRQPLIL